MPLAHQIENLPFKSQGCQSPLLFQFHWLFSQVPSRLLVPQVPRAQLDRKTPGLERPSVTLVDWGGKMSSSLIPKKPTQAPSVLSLECIRPFVPSATVSPQISSGSPPFLSKLEEEDSDEDLALF